MYNLWIITIILAVAGIAGIVAIWVLYERERDAATTWREMLDVEDTEGSRFFVSAMIVIAILALVFASIAGPIKAKMNVNELLHEGEALQSLVDGREGLDKPYILERVVEYNKQVSEILAKVKVRGRWSPYYFTDYELLKCIEI